MKSKILKSIASTADKYPVLMVSVALIITLAAAFFMDQLKMKMHFKNLMPEEHSMVQEFDKVIDNFSSAAMIVVAATGDEEELKSFADELVPKLKLMDEYIKRVDYKLEKEFYQRYGFMLEKAKNLKNSKEIFSDLSLLPMLEHINDNFEKTYISDDKSISNKEKENKAISFLDGIQYWLSTIDKYVKYPDSVDIKTAQKAVDRFLIGDEYMISQDKDMIFIMAQPTFSINEVDKVVDAENKVNELIDKTVQNYPTLLAGTTGTTAIIRDETIAMQEDAYWTSIVAFVLIIILFVVSFRMWVAPLLAGIALIVGVVWAGGFAALTLGSLNMMTSMFVVILLGLGIDFSIHIITVYTESRAAGFSNKDSLELTLLKSGNGIITGGITTSLAFFTLTVSRTAGIKELGIVAGSGVIFCMLSSIVVLPAILSLRDKLLIKFNKEKYTARSTEFHFLGKIASSVSKNYRISLIAGIIITAFLLYEAFQIKFDYNYLNMEPEGLTSIELQHIMEDEFNITPDFSVVTTSKVGESRRITEEAKDLKIVGMVTSISEYVPSSRQVEKRVPFIKEIKNYLTNNTKVQEINEGDLDNVYDQLYRIEDNVIELSQLAYLGGQDKVDEKCKQLVGDLEDENNKTVIQKLVQKLKRDEQKARKGLNVFLKDYEPSLRQKALQMTTLNPIEITDLPANIYNRFANKDSSKYLVSIYPRKGVWEDLQFLKLFTTRMNEIDSRMTGMPSIFYVLIEIIGKDGQLAAALTLIVVFFLLLFDYKNLRLTLMAMVPLIIGAIWMVGIMHLIGHKLTIMNVIGIPLILGIGIDYGVHLLHRYDIEGLGSIKTVYKSTGKAVLLTSLTTMLAFGSLIFATYRGLGSMGSALFIGVSSCLLTSLLILPALIGLIENRKKIKSNK
ncbi:MAG: MMPL family transporter [Ignavibacteria bacterium]|jgi:predicted RND superfamily exporter protein